ncbi:MAG: hypothetical protein DME83_04440 [Verrucomicrobia bacterium]|nr:MAG: hypothetical protein DME83_04440 [Verrucomicrobiota bacterium]
MQELVDLSAKAISNRIFSGSCALVSVAGFDDPALRLFAASYGILGRFAPRHARALRTPVRIAESIDPHSSPH